MLVDSWTKPIETVAESLRLAADHLDTISKIGEVSFQDLSRILHVLQSAQAIVRLIPDSLGDLRSYINERKNDGRVHPINRPGNAANLSS